MRRFVDSMAGRALCHLAVMALVVPTVTLGVTGRAQAQAVQQLPSWAVTEFKDLKNPSSKYGVAAADAVSGELAKTNRYDVVSQETVKRSIETLQLSSPLDGIVNLSRVGTDVRATTIVTGEVADYRIKQVGGGKQAIVAVRAIAYDVASGLPVNGSIAKGESIVRGGNVTDDVLVSDAISQAAAIAVRSMQGQQTPTATVLNTTPLKALINQGSRSGFRGGDTVLVTRGGLQVATGHLANVEFDQAELIPDRGTKGGDLGIAPGDKVRTVFSPPVFAAGRSPIDSKDNISVANNRHQKTNNATLISALLVVGLIAVLLSSGNSNQTSTASLTAQATYTNEPQVNLSWSTNAFAGGNDNKVTWQIYRSDNQAVPIIVVNGQRTNAVDKRSGPITELQDYTAPYTNMRPKTCLNTSYGGTALAGTTTTGTTATTATTTGTVTTTTNLQPGQTYTYFIEEVYRITSIDEPDGSTTSSGTTTGTGTNTGTNTGTGTTTTTTSTTSGTTGSTNSGTTTAGTTATTGTSSTTGNSTTSGTSGTIDCYGMSGRAQSGLVTPLERPEVGAPDTIPTGTGTSIFPITSVRNAFSSAPIDYQLEFSNSANFAKGSTVYIKIPARVEQGSFTATIDFSSSAFSSTAGRLVRAATTVYYRVGAKGSSDRKSPKPDSVAALANGQGYIYSAVQSFNRGTPPPAP